MNVAEKLNVSQIAEKYGMSYTKAENSMRGIKPTKKTRCWGREIKWYSVRKVEKTLNALGVEKRRKHRERYGNIWHFRKWDCVSYDKCLTIAAQNQAGDDVWPGMECATCERYVGEKIKTA